MSRFISMSFLLCLSLTSSFAIPHSNSLINTGHSAQYRQEDNHGNYEFGYNEDHAEGGTFRKEKGTPHGVIGSYGLRGADGRVRIVHYIADEHGFRATIETNEAGIDTSQSPAAVAFTNGHQMPLMHASSSPTEHVETVSHHNPSHFLPSHKPTSLAVSHSLPTPVIERSPVAAVAEAYRSFHYEPEQHQAPAFEAVLAPLINHQHANDHAPLHTTPSYSHLRYIPEDELGHELHMNAYDGDFGRRFSSYKSQY